MAVPARSNSNGLRHTPATFSADEGRELKRQYLAGETTPQCPRCRSEMEVETGWRSRHLVTELSCSVCHRCVMFRPDRHSKS